MNESNPFKNVSGSSKEHGNDHDIANKCIMCQDLCACEVVNYCDSNRELSSGEFRDKKLICKKSMKKIKKDYQTAIKKGELLETCSFAYYLDLVYETELNRLQFGALSCKHVDDTKLLKKRMDTITSDYVELVAMRENKEIIGDV